MIRHHMTNASMVILGCSLTFASCVPNQSSRVVGGRNADPNIISESEIISSQATTVYEVIERTRPRFLTSRVDLAAGSERQVFLAGSRLGGIGQMRIVPASSVREIRFVRSAEGAGSAHNSGAVILLVARTGW